MLRPGHLVILVAVCLLAIGVAMVHSASMNLSGETTLSGLLLGRPTALAAAAVICLLLATRVPIDRLGVARGLLNPAPWLLIAAVLLLLAVHIPGVGREANGATRWIQVGPVGFQPSEIAKWGLPFVISVYAVRHARRMHEFVRGFALPLAVVAFCCGLIAASDLGTAVLIMVVSVSMLIVAGARIVYPLLAAPLLAAAAAALVVISPYRWNRIVAYIDPYVDREGIGYHIIQSMAAIHGGGLSGRGLGNSVQKFGYLPESTTDFIFAIICEELGVVGAAAVGILYVALIVTGIAIMRGVAASVDEGTAESMESSPAWNRAEFCRLFAFGILMTVGTQAAINLSVVTGLAPTKGIALPLVSHGGTGWLLTAFSIGLLAAIDRRSMLTATARPDADEPPTLAHLRPG